MDTHLKLEQYFFPHIQVSADPTCDDISRVNDIDYEVKVGLAKHEEEEKYQLTLEISSFPEDDDSTQPYSMQVVVIGIFEVVDWPDPEKLLLINGSSILYSAAREFVITTSSRGPWGPLTLPVYSFLKHFQKLAEEKKSSPEE
jgi:preprotein translocase subunit SecB